MRKYNKQLLLVFGILSFIRGTQVFIDERRSELTAEGDSYSYIPDQNFELDDTNNPIYVITVDEQNSNHRKE
jgi:hypothetical protein